MRFYEGYWRQAVRFKWWRVSNLLLRRPSTRMWLSAAERRPTSLLLPFGDGNHEVQDFFFDSVNPHDIQLAWRGDAMEPWRGNFEVIFRHTRDAVRYKLTW